MLFTPIWWSIKDNISKKPGKASVLIIEDNEVLSDMYKFKLELDGFDVVAEYDGTKWLKRLEEYEPDVILLDIMMPGINGYEVLEELRNWRKIKSKIIVFSNLNDPKDRDRAVRLWADKFILKASLTPKELIDEIKEILNLRPEDLKIR